MSSLSLSSFSTSSYPLHLEPVSPTTPSPLLNIITVYHVEPQLPDASTLAISPSDLQKRADIPVACFVGVPRVCEVDVSRLVVGALERRVFVFLYFHVVRVQDDWIDRCESLEYQSKVT
ncbi:hypothetical protein EYC84_003132 [Monilinia fructicola]|uniref:Uncharacterized protein n=1 Tax=Monilinia fructicola TaxID=38448 RepID=A0A5M9JWM7_MONFR|nr:hypothetical protein EYC84_003132 [Monilinia fructicola]